MANNLLTSAKRAPPPTDNNDVSERVTADSEFEYVADGASIKAADLVISVSSPPSPANRFGVGSGYISISPIVTIKKAATIINFIFEE